MALNREGGVASDMTNSFACIFNKGEEMSVYNDENTEH